MGDWKTFVKLLKELKTVSGMQKKRLILQGVIFITLFVLVATFSRKKWTRGTSELAYRLDSLAFIGMLFAASVIGSWYEMYSPSLAHGTTPVLWATLSWVFVQIWLSVFMFNLLCNGNITRNIVYNEVVSYLTGKFCPGTSFLPQSESMVVTSTLTLPFSASLKHIDLSC